MSSAPKPGAWTSLGVTSQAGTPAVIEGSNDEPYVLWLNEPTTSEFTYEVAQLASNGSVAHSASSIFGTSYWGSLSSQPTFVPASNGPIIVFDGQRTTSSSDPYSHGCIVGAQAAAGTWTLLSWSLSATCVNPVGTATATKSGALSAAWPGLWAGGHGVAYRVGQSSSIPASTPDLHIALPGPATAYKVGEASDFAGNGDVYVAWAREFSSPASGDGIYVKDVTAGIASAKAPGTGTNSIDDVPVFGDLPIANTSSHKGVFLVYCSNTSPCGTLELWRVGATSALKVPGSSGAADVAVSQGAQGRLWIAWYNESTNAVTIVHTNEADTKFSSATKYSTPCVEHGLIGLSSGSYQRLTIAMQCVVSQNNNFVTGEFSTQALAGLALSPHSVSIVNTSSHTVTFSVSDVGDPVSGATVSVAGKSAKTSSSGTVTFSFQKGMAAGSYSVTARKANYRPDTGTLKVTN